MMPREELNKLRTDLRLFTKSLPTRDEIVQILDSHIEALDVVDRAAATDRSACCRCGGPNEPEKPKSPLDDAGKLFEDLVRGRITVPEVATGLLSMLLPR